MKLSRNNSKTVFKPSKYNHFFQGDSGDVLAYNAFSNTFARVSQEKFKTIQAILEEPDNSSILSSDDDRKLKSDLLRTGFLIDTHLDEFEILKTQHSIGRFASRCLSITIAPTLACNFKCTYCFETPKGDTMTPETQKRLISYVHQKLADSKELSVSWFGGEPLLKMDVIENLIKAFKVSCKEHKVTYLPSSIITNGYLLTREMAVRLKEAGIISAQVTIDGVPEVHDLRRVLLNGEGTFRRILENIKEASEIIKIVVRVNIDKDNIDSLDRFFSLWQKERLAEKCAFYFGHVRSNTPACADMSGQCLSTREYSEMMVSLLKRAKEQGIGNIQYPSLCKTGYCMADNLNGFVIAPSGKIFKCWEEISADDEDSVGSVFDNQLTPGNIMNTSKYLNWDPFANEDCKNCSVFPICGGGCIYNGLTASSSNECTFWKYNLEDMLKLKFEEVKKRRFKMDFIVENLPVYDFSVTSLGYCEGITCSAFGACKINCGKVNCAILSCGTMAFTPTGK